VDVRRFLRVRKSAWFVLFLMVILVIERIGPTFWHSSHTTAATPTSDSLRLILAKGWVDGNAFEIDSIFDVGRARVYVIAKGETGPRATVQWYWEGTRQTEQVCQAINPCVTSLGPDSLHIGNWSVDLVEGNHLLASRQFHVVESVTP